MRMPHLGGGRQHRLERAEQNGRRPSAAARAESLRPAPWERPTAPPSDPGGAVVKMTSNQWLNLGLQLFGPAHDHWQFKCPRCGLVAKILDWKAYDRPDLAGFACIGTLTNTCGCRHKDSDVSPNPVEVTSLTTGVKRRFFEFG